VKFGNLPLNCEQHRQKSRTGIDGNPFADGSAKEYKGVLTKNKSLLEKWTKLKATKLNAAEQDELLTRLSTTTGV